jgi:hypothetical protein
MAIERMRIKNRCELVDAVEEELECMASWNKELRMVWVPSHCGIEGNELADQAADRAASRTQEGVACSFNGVKRRLVKTESRGEWKSERCRKIYAERKVKIEEEDKWSREEMVSWSRFRCGHSLELASYRRRIGLGGDGLCRRCGLEEETTDHVWSCDAGEAKRRVLGLGGLGDLVGESSLGLEYWRWWRRKRLKPPQE